jgi:hypothetical protein
MDHQLIFDVLIYLLKFLMLFEINDHKLVLDDENMNDVMILVLQNLFELKHFVEIFSTKQKKKILFKKKLKTTLFNLHHL